LSQWEVHGSLGGEIKVQPWGERSFYADDPWHNPLCFVAAGLTVFTASVASSVKHSATNQSPLNTTLRVPHRETEHVDASES
jgi:hypothetical protein